MPHKNVEYEVEDRTAWLTMNRPEALNALSRGMFRELEAKLRDASKDHAVSFIAIKGEGRAFSAGLDVKEVSGFASHREAREFVYSLVKPFWRRFLECEKPILSMVDGPAYGAGAEIALASDILVASTGSRFAFSGGRVGALCCISAAFGQFAMIGRKVVEMNLTGAPISADEARSHGLVNYVEENTHLRERVDRLLSEMRNVSPISNASFKRIHRSLFSIRALDLAHRELFRTITSPDFVRGAAAFKEKVHPEYYQ
ncbi:MAG TPA: enoyl-CoA hydratase/isomerase family protein [Candidatus Angelobacter sp.]|nr:enoyl-CoA hydratase/isomerase family protein [Candidatus Angelobacter sp.]